MLSEDLWVPGQEGHDFFKASDWLKYCVFEDSCELVFDAGEKDSYVKRVEFQLLSQVLVKAEAVEPLKELTVIQDFKDSSFDLNGGKKGT